MCIPSPRMAGLNPYSLGVLLEWRRLAAARGEHANRVIPAPVPEAVSPWTPGCIFCHRDARTLRAVGHRAGCVMGTRRQLS